MGRGLTGKSIPRAASDADVDPEEDAEADCGGWKGDGADVPEKDDAVTC